MRIGLDLDGVVYNFTRAYNAKLIELGHTLELDDKAKSWDYFKEYGYSTEQFLAHLDDMVDTKTIFWDGQLCEEDIPYYIREWRSLGHTVHIITNRFTGKKLSSHEATYSFLSDRGIEYDSLTFSADKTVVKTDIFLEDSPKNYDALAASGIEVWLVDKLYNQNGPDEYRRRVSSFYEFYELVMLRHYNR